MFDALGVRVDEVPVTPEKIVRALEEQAKGRMGRVGPRDFPRIEWPESLKVAPPWEGGDGRAQNEAPKQPKAPRPEPRP